jgi:hypothetical protein
VDLTFYLILKAGINYSVLKESGIFHIKELYDTCRSPGVVRILQSR